LVRDSLIRRIIMQQQHKWAKVIHAWAEGYTVQRIEKLCCDKSYKRWVDCTSTPMWFEDEEYRIKPVNKDE